MTDNTLKYKIGIGLIPMIGCIMARKLIAYTGGVEAVFTEKRSNLLKIPSVGEAIAREISSQQVLQRAEREIEFMEKNDIKALFYLDKGFPARLQHCEDAPLILFVKGDANMDSPKILSIVGTRSATEYGKELCSKIISGLAANHQELLIVSGLAYGIDICAHKEALANNLQTVAVLGHGLGTVYPGLHKNIAARIVKQGALTTEFLHDAGPDKPNFVKRNRIIAGMADATLVVESAVRGGALITADLANSYNRDVLAIPGRSHDEFSAGCNKLIKTNKAALVEGAEDIEYILGWQVEKRKTTQRNLFPKLAPEELKIFNVLKENGELTIDILCLKAEMPVSKASALLLNMEFSGVVRSLPGKVYAALT
jgi:DNA processing protein